MRSLLIAVLGVFCLGAAVRAQDASLIGSVTDDTKAVLPGATITATGVETGVQRVAVADASGQYRLRLPAGTYKLASTARRASRRGR